MRWIKGTATWPLDGYGVRYTWQAPTWCSFKTRITRKEAICAICRRAATLSVSRSAGLPL